ncbi:valyl-tRNA synthetase [Anaeromyxobacter dehalogenans 2CP-1]|uniref:Valine--tRNA ligase n=1 Tax=Anaeromyxobacter dehalogenans (strain ATCC BAA-258 / DSM 21875 / 2CP-1) TaxID=455488 RepID=B8J558_ANAD2|nr:valine--tRNA ligase [Anaeromyxobacter dehalogenans]ACL64913.1 valyl-tRNA synthetase [Anaeromyxobacter dehalogenans 2CP-1]
MSNPNPIENENRTELAKGYEHREVEARWYPFWQERGYFHGDEHDRTRPPFSIVLPPPNVTGSLHLGHALTATLQDVLIRWKRMSGFNTLWLPGTDHAGIATQMIVEKELKKTEKKSRHDLGREAFLERVWAWKEQYGSRIGEQHKALGASLDWQRERFTMDEGLSRAVREVFVRLHEEGLIYREKKLINWCPDCRTALSDLEVEHEEAHQGELWSFAYPLADGSGEIVVATTRPETMLGDTAVAVHPLDPRYMALHGKKVRHPITGRTFPIVADSILVDPKFGTGAVKVTPAHDFNDFEVGKRHGLEMITVIGPDGRMTAEAGALAGLDRFEARKEVKRLLAEQGLDRGAKPHVLPLGRCQRSATILEPLLSDQWYVRIEPLARPAIEAVEQGRTRFIPEQWTNTYMAWMRNIHDWCISRQLWWGHQIPAWYCPDGHVTVARQTPEACSTCGKGELRQDEDVLDTWFSSGLWPFSTMGWPEQTETLRTFYPTSVMETGHDIIFFWVARMMMMGLHFMGEVPFRTVYLHPMVRDEKGQKMSKTKGNVIDPLVITDQYGADALRFTLAALTAQGRDIKLAKERIEGYRAFANKLWNASRFALMNLSGYQERGEDPARLARTPADRWILARLQRAVNETVEALDAFRFNDAANAVYAFVWHELCDWYIELAKEALASEDPEARRSVQAVLVHCLQTSYRLLHPFMPFITEELWHVLRAQVGASDWADSVLAAKYPRKGEADGAAESAFRPVLGIIDAVRNIRGEMGIPWKVKLGAQAPVEIAVADPALRDLLQAGELARVHRVAGVEGSRLVVAAATAPAPQSAVGVGPGFEVRVPLAGVIDLAAETARVDKEIGKVDQDLAVLERKLQNPSFVQNAPAAVVEKDRARAEELREKRGKLEAHRAMLSGSEANSARRDTMEIQNEQKPTQDGPAAESQPAQENTVVESAEKAVAVVSEAAQQAATAVASGIEKVAEAVRKTVRRSVKKAAATRAAMKKKVAKKAPAKKPAAKKAAAKKPAGKKKVAKKAPAKKVARKPAAKKTAKKPARKAAKRK